MQALVQIRTIAGGRAPLRSLQAQLLGHVLELAMHLGPLANAQEIEEIVATRAAQLRHAAVQRLAHERPQLEQTQEVGALVAKATVQLIGLLLQAARSLAWILD